MEREVNSEPLRVGYKYPRAPITEAIIEIRVRPNDMATAQSCRDAFESLAAEFSERKELRLMQAKISAPAGQAIGAETTESVIGYSRHSKQRAQTITASIERFAFSQLPPYDSWEAFSPEARRFWTMFREATRPLKVNRVATRFVNRIEIPIPIQDIAGFFRTGPEISSDMSQELSGYFMQLQLPQQDLGCSAIVNQALLPATESNATVAPFVLDIDIFDETSDFSSEETIWNRLEEFRHRKNQIFEACITNRIRKLIS